MAEILDACDLKVKTATNAISKLRALGKLPKVAPATVGNKEKWWLLLPCVAGSGLRLWREVMGSSTRWWRG